MINERLDEFFQSEGLSYYRVEKDLELSTGLISGAFKHNRNLGANVIEKILLSYPKLNPDWLFRGRGKMKMGAGDHLQEPSVDYTNKSDEILIERACDYFGFSDKTQLTDFFERLNKKSITANPDILAFRVERLELLVGEMMLKDAEKKKT